MAEGAGALVDEHRQAVGIGDAEGFGLGEELRLRRVVDHVVHTGGLRELDEVGGRGVGVAEACAGGVDHDGAGG